MSLTPIVQDINEVEESLRPYYKETEKGFMLDVQESNGYALENVQGLRSALSKERGRAQEFERKTSQYSELGDMTPSDIREALEELNSLKQLDPNKEADKIADQKLKSFQEQMTKKHQTEVGTAKQAADRYKGQLQGLLIDDAAKNAILAAGGNEKTIAYMLPTVKASLSLRETENGFMTQVIDSSGNPQIGDSNGNPMTVSQLVEQLKSQELWSGAFPGRNRSGGGKQSDSAGGTPTTSIKRSDMTSDEKSLFVKEHGKAAYFKLKP